MFNCKLHIHHVELFVIFIFICAVVVYSMWYFNFIHLITLHRLLGILYYAIEYKLIQIYILICI